MRRKWSRVSSVGVLTWAKCSAAEEMVDRFPAEPNCFPLHSGVLGPTHPPTLVGTGGVFHWGKAAGVSEAHQTSSAEVNEWSLYRHVTCVMYFSAANSTDVN